MKKKLLTLGVLSALALSLTACEAPFGLGKAPIPTLEELKEGFRNDAQSGTMTAYVSMEGDGEVSIKNASDEIEEVLDMLDLYYGIDLSKGVNFEFSLEDELEGERTETMSHQSGEASLDFDCNIDALMDELDGVLDEFSQDQDIYTDYDEEVKYTLKGGDTWVVSDLDDDDDGLAFEDVVDLMISYNENVDEDDQIVITEDDGKYFINKDFTIDNDYISDLDKTGKKNLQKIFDGLDMDLDVDEIVDFYEMYGDYAEISIPVSIEFGFIDNGKKKADRLFYATDITLSMGFEVSVSLGTSDVQEIFLTLGCPEDEIDLYTCSVSGEFNVSVSLEGHFTPGDVDEIEIPKKVTKDAIDEDEYEAMKNASSYDYDDYDFDDYDFDDYEWED